MSELKAITVEDCLVVQPLPKTQDVRLDLYYCARGLCYLCSRKSEKGCRKKDIGGCRFGLLEDANELLGRLGRI